MYTAWKDRFVACLLLLALLPTVIYFVVSEQPSLGAFVAITISYFAGLPLGQQLFQYTARSTSTVTRPLSSTMVWMISLTTTSILGGMQLLGYKRLMGDIGAVFLSTLCGIVTYAIGYYWRTRPR